MKHEEDIITRGLDKAIASIMRLRLTHRFMLFMAALAVFITYFAWTEKVDSRYHCDNNGLAVIAGSAPGHSTIWDIAHKYCTGNIVQATDDLVDIYDADLMPGQIIHLRSND